MRVLLIGMNNPHSTKPEHALYPHPPGVAGWNLWRKIAESVGGEDVLGRKRYTELFDRRNLVRGDWHRATAATNAAIMFRKERIDERRVVLCGADVSGAFRRAGAAIPEDRELFEWFRPGPSPLGKWAIIPHPSGRSHAWNDVAIRDEARKFFKALVKLAEEMEHSR